MISFAEMSEMSNKYFLSVIEWRLGNVAFSILEMTKEFSMDLQDAPKTQYIHSMKI